MSENVKKWIKAAGVRALKTFAQTAVATLGTAALLTSVDWTVVASTAVMSLQRLLICSKYSCGNYGADGEFGNDTLTAVKKFQTDKGLTVDGIVGANTWAKLIKG